MTAEELYTKAYELHYKGGDTASAMPLYQRVLSDFGGSPQAGYAKSQIANIEGAGGGRSPQTPIAEDRLNAPAPPSNAGRCTRCGQGARYVAEQSQYWCDQCALYVVAPPANLGAVVARQPIAAESQVGTLVAALLGGGLLALGPFLSWLTLGMLSASGFQKIGNEAFIVVVLGLLGLIFAAEGLSDRTKFRRGGSVVVGLISVALSVFYMAKISENISQIQIGTPGIGMGLYMCLIGGVLLTVSGLVSPTQSRS